MLATTGPGRQDRPSSAGPSVGRNEPCPCGSGRKHKRCCGREALQGPGRSGRWLVLVGLLALAGLAAAGALLRRPAPPGAVWSPEHGHWHYATTDAPLLPPPGETPPGKVWSFEHGHWHDAAGTPGPPPPGPIPEGKEWSWEHGHWHDLINPGATPPPGPTPPGKVWSQEHGHWHAQE